mgnify:CR=1 FL=1
MKKVMLASIATTLFCIGGTAFADSLANLERQRALFIKTLLAEQRSEGNSPIPIIEGRLMDLERAVANDRSLEKRFSSHARKALSSYDLTFLVHSAAEANKPTFAHWVDQVGLSSTDIEAASVGRY